MSSQDSLKQLSTYLRESDDLYQAIIAEAKNTGLSISDILRLALIERQERKMADYRARGFQPDQVPATP